MSPPDNLPVVSPRASRPLYVDAFECFTRGNPDQIEGFVAFGMFVASEYAWAERISGGSWPPDEKMRELYARLLHDSEVRKTMDAAKRVVDEHRDKLVREHQKKFFDGVFQQVEEKLGRRHFWWGVTEATLGAFFWTLILIIISICINLAGIDVMHVLNSLTGLGHK